LLHVTFPAFEGQKHICIDDDYLRKAENGDCLVYSFGLADDWDFEEASAALNCKVRAFDPSVEALPDL